jgi:photosystem II stability/assembly factor-like uncharacterized protein
MVHLNEKYSAYNYIHTLCGIKTEKMKNLFLILNLIFLTLNLFGQFQYCNSSVSKDLHDLCFIDQNIGIAVGDSGTIVRSIDGGINWDLIMGNDTVNFKKVKFFDVQNGIAIGSDIYMTNDAGLSWSKTPHGNEYYYDIEILNQTTCIISGGPVALIKSSNTGMSFIDLVVPQNGHFGLLSFVNENIGYACNKGGGGSSPTLKTTNGGINWTMIQSGGNVNSVMEAMSFVSEAIGFKGGWYNASLQKTSDSAINWSNINYEDSLTYGEIYDFHIKQSQPNSYYACGWYGQIFKSTDGGSNWIELNSGLSNTTTLYGIFFINDTIGWAVGQNGTIIRTSNGGETVGLFDIEENLKLSLFPNPTRDLVHIAKQEAFEIREIRLYDLNGQELMSENNKETINLRPFPDGIYIIEIKTDKGISRRKIVKK